MTICSALLSKLDQPVCRGLKREGYCREGVTCGGFGKSQEKRIPGRPNQGNTMRRGWRGARAADFAIKPFRRELPGREIWPHFKPSDKAVMVLNKNTAP